MFPFKTYEVTVKNESGDITAIHKKTALTAIRALEAVAKVSGYVGSVYTIKRLKKK